MTEKDGPKIDFKAPDGMLELIRDLRSSDCDESAANEMLAAFLELAEGESIVVAINNEFPLNRRDEVQVISSEQKKKLLTNRGRFSLEEARRVVREENYPVNWRELCGAGPYYENASLEHYLNTSSALACFQYNGFLSSRTLLDVTFEPDPETEAKVFVSLKYIAPFFHDYFFHPGNFNRFVVPREPKRNLQGQLTPREREILNWIGEGKTSWEIGKIVSISERTVKFHLHNIFIKLNVVNRSQAVARAMETGLLNV